MQYASMINWHDNSVCSHGVIIANHTQICTMYVFFFFRHPSLRAARKSGFWSPGKNTGSMRHYYTQHRRYRHALSSRLCLCLITWKHLMGYDTCINKVTVFPFFPFFFFLKQCPATSSSSSLSSLWLSKPSLVNMKTQGERQSDTLTVFHSSLTFFICVLLICFVFFICLSGCLLESGSWMETTWSSLLALASSFL